MGLFETLISFGIVALMVMLLIISISKKGDWIMVGVAVFGLLALALAFTVWRPSYGVIVWPLGPVLWVSLACLIAFLKLIDTEEPAAAPCGNAFCTGFMAWTMLTVAAALMLAFVRHGVTGDFDDKVFLGILTLGQVQLGFAGILDKGLRSSRWGILAWRTAAIVGCGVFLVSLAWSIVFIFFTPSFST